MDTKDIIFELRTKNGLSQDELAEKLFVTRQAVSRWENGDTVPNTETLKLLSRLFETNLAPPRILRVPWKNVTTTSLPDFSAQLISFLCFVKTDTPSLLTQFFCRKHILPGDTVLRWVQRPCGNAGMDIRIRAVSSILP